jgi:hypothetical protein
MSARDAAPRRLDPEGVQKYEIRASRHEVQREREELRGGVRSPFGALPGLVVGSAARAWRSA